MEAVKNPTPETRKRAPKQAIKDMTQIRLWAEIGSAKAAVTRAELAVTKAREEVQVRITAAQEREMLAKEAEALYASKFE
jgi:hypothetical protein